MRKAWLSYEGQRLPVSLPISNEVRVTLLKLYEAGFLFQFTYQSQFPSTLQLGPRAHNATNLISPQHLLHLIHDLTEAEEELIETAKETVKQFLLQREYGCERATEGRGYLTCFALEGQTDDLGKCTYQGCQQICQLRSYLKTRQRDDKPCSFSIEFDASRSPEPHYWGQCTYCGAIGIFPGSFKHDVFCRINCRDGDWPGHLEGVEFKTEEEYWTVNRALVDFEAKEIQEAYIAAREEPFHKQTR